MISGPNSGYSGWAYIIHPSYAVDPHHYVRAYLSIQAELERLFDYIEPSDECATAYSYKIHALLVRACIEVEANFKAILLANKYSHSRNLNMKHYGRVDKTHHLSSYEVRLPIWNPSTKIFFPFGVWRSERDNEAPNRPVLPWYKAYNDSKHDRHEKFKKANLENLVDAVAGLLVLITAQFGSQSFDAGKVLLATSGYSYHDMEPSTGGLFRISGPQDWMEKEKYDFDWSV
ncbi:MAG: hypothetical protein R3D81_12130 [Thalassovita sp.]